MTIEPDRLRVEPATMAHYVETLGACGQQPGGGMIRPLYSPAWAQAQQVLTDLMIGNGLEVHRDAVGNLFGTLRGSEHRTVLTGSHIDTVRLGGKYDGALGVLSGIAALGVLREAAGAPRRTLQVVGLCEEEASRFHANFFGTRGILGLIDPGELDSLQDDDGVSLREAMRGVGLDPGRYSTARRQDVDCFIELHIEQGRRLYDSGINIGVVTTITGIYWQIVTVRGRADHAGTTPMGHRSDALLGASRMAIAIAEQASAVGDPAVATVGRLKVFPGGSNIVPEEVVFSVDARHPDQRILDDMVASIGRQCAAIADELGLGLEVATVKREAPAATDAGLRQVIGQAAQQCGLTWQEMSSGAGHDSQLMAQHLPAAMIFIPSVDGRSHTPAEYTTPEDCMLGAQVLATALHSLAY